MERGDVNSNPIVVINDKRLTKIIFLTVLVALGISCVALWYTASISSVVEDIGIVRELEKAQYNQQLYLDLAAKLDSTQDEILKIQEARMDTAAANRADYVKIQRRTDSIIAYETKTRALDAKIRAIYIEELKRKGLWNEKTKP